MAALMIVRIALHCWNYRLLVVNVPFNETSLGIQVRNDQKFVKWYEVCQSVSDENHKIAVDAPCRGR
jgi:hypothetical protein